MNNNWELVNTSNLNQMLRVRNDKSIENIVETFPNLLKIKHQYHVADDIMFPDPACLAFFSAFEENHLTSLENQNKLVLSAVDIFEGNYSFYIYCEDAQETILDCIEFLKSNSLYKCDFEIINNDKGYALSLIK